MTLPLVGGAIGGAVGAAIWAAIAYFLGLEIGWIAWGIGVMVGLGTKLAAPDRLSIQTGVSAALIAVVAVAGGKYLAVHLSLDKALDELSAGSYEITDELATSYFADEVVIEYEQEGQPVRWPGGATPQNPAYQHEYPADVWAEAAERYAELTPAERAEYKAELGEIMRESLTAFRNEAQEAGFRESFGFLDLLFLALAIGSAFKIASGEALAAS